MQLSERHRIRRQIHPPSDKRGAKAGMGGCWKGLGRREFGCVGAAQRVREHVIPC